MCASANECHHPHPTPPHPIPCDACAGDSGVEKMMQNCGCVYLWLQSVCAGDSGKWLCAHVTPVCVRGWLWVEKVMQNCACVYLWLQSVRAGDPLTHDIYRERCWGKGSWSGAMMTRQFHHERPWEFPRKTWGPEKRGEQKNLAEKLKFETSHFPISNCNFNFEKKTLGKKTCDSSKIIGGYLEKKGGCHWWMPPWLLLGSS